MNIDALVAEVENIAPDLNVISGFNAFVDAVSHIPVVELLIDALKHSPTNGEIVLQRLLALSDQGSDGSYAHPNDPAIAVFLYILWQVDHKRAFEVASRFAQTAQLWWSRRLANHIIALQNILKIDSRSRSETRTIVMGLQKLTDQSQAMVYITPTAKAALSLSFKSDSAIRVAS